MRGPRAASLRIAIALAAGTVVASACGPTEDTTADPGEAPATGAPRTAAPRPRAAPVPVEEPPVPTRSPLLADGDLGAWIPPADLVEAAAGLGDPERRTAAWEALSDDERQVDVLRAGLRLRDATAARTAACGLSWLSLDSQEASRFVRLRVEALLDPAFTLPDGTRPRFDGVPPACGAADVAWILDRFGEIPSGAAAPDFGDGDDLDDLSMAVGLGTLDAIVRALDRDDPVVGPVALRMLAELASHTDQRRVEIAAALLGVAPGEAAARFPREEDLIAAALASGRARNSESSDSFDEWGWRRRWELRRTGAIPAPAPSPEDEATICVEPAGLLLEHLRARPHAAIGILLGTDGDPSADDDAPSAGDAAEARIGMFGEALAGLVPWDPSLEASLQGFADAALRADHVPTDLLIRIGLVVPGCRTRRFAEALLDRLDAAEWPFADYACGRPEVDPALPYFEVCARDAFVGRLRRWAASDDAATRSSAIQALLDLGDVASADAIVRWAEGVRERNHAKVPWLELGRLPHPGVRAFLVRHVEEAAGEFPPSVRLALAALAWSDGVHCDWKWIGSLPSDEVPEIARLILEGRGTDALFRAAESEPGNWLWEIGHVRDPRTVPFLRRLRDRREQDLYVRLTGELALAGDAEARAEVLAAIRDGRYGWIAVLPLHVRDLGDALVMAPVWLAALESNGSLCREVLPWFEATFDVHGGGDGCGREATHAARIRAFFDRHGGRFVESRLAGKFVPGPR